MSQGALDLQIRPPARRRGRPPGSRNKGSLQLGKYLEAHFGGLTPGQQAAELAMVKPAEIKRAKADALELGIPDAGLAPTQLAMVVKAARLARALGITRAEAWAALHKVLFELMPYVHQRQPQASEPKDGPQATVYMVPEGDAQDVGSVGGPGESDPIDLIEDFRPDADQVSPDKSHDDA